MQYIAPGKIYIDDAAGERIRKDAGYAVDFHVHSNFSFDVFDPLLTPQYLATKMIQQGLTPVLTDHDIFAGNYDGKKFVDNNFIDSEYISGVEFSIKPRWMRLITGKKIDDVHMLHINVFKLQTEDYKLLQAWADAGEMDEFIRYCKMKNLPYVLNHPFWSEMGEILNWKMIPLIIKAYFPVIELNAKMTTEQNDLTVKMAEELDISLIAASDTHIGLPGIAQTFADADNFDEFWWEYVIPGRVYLQREDLSTNSLLSEVRKYVMDFLITDKEYIKSKNFRLNTSFGMTARILRKVLYSGLTDKKSILRLAQLIMDGRAMNGLRNQLVNSIHMNREQRFIEAISTTLLTICQILVNVDELIPEPV